MAISRPESVADADRIDQADAWFEEVDKNIGSPRGGGLRPPRRRRLVPGHGRNGWGRGEYPGAAQVPAGRGQCRGTQDARCHPFALGQEKDSANLARHVLHHVATKGARANQRKHPHLTGREARPLRPLSPPIPDSQPPGTSHREPL